MARASTNSAKVRSADPLNEKMAVKTSEIRVSNLRSQERADIQDLSRTTPAERLQMMWQLALDAWAFKGEPVAELRLPRHIVRVLRREG
jgi:hypothetical protein